MSTINTINKEFLSFFKDYKIDLKSQFLIGVSAGNDSMAVLNLAVESKLKVSVAHVNYQLRNEESERDYKIVKEYCKINNLNFYYKKVKIDNLKNLQKKAREIRYKYYNEIIKAKVNHGINASSISDISHIPRATVIRKLKWLTRHKLIKKNKELEYLMRKGGKINEKTNKIFMLNRNLVLTFVADIIDLIKNSKFEI